SMKRFVLIAVAAALVAASSAPASPVAHAARRAPCGTIRVHEVDYRVSIWRGQVYCSTARNVLLKFLRGHGRHHGAGLPLYKQYWTLYGWRCSKGRLGGGCVRHGTDYRTARDYILAVH